MTNDDRLLDQWRSRERTRAVAAVRQTEAKQQRDLVEWVVVWWSNQNNQTSHKSTAA